MGNGHSEKWLYNWSVVSVLMGTSRSGGGGIFHQILPKTRHFPHHFQHDDISGLTPRYFFSIEMIVVIIL